MQELEKPLGTLAVTVNIDTLEANGFYYLAIGEYSHRIRMKQIYLSV